MHRRQHLGAVGEDLARDHLERTGHTIVAQNWRIRKDDVTGELDLIATDVDATVLIVEVRTRMTRNAGIPEHSVDRKKRRQLRRLTSMWIAEHDHNGPVRGDVIAVDGSQLGTGWLIRHHKGVW